MKPFIVVLLLVGLGFAGCFEEGTGGDAHVPVRDEPPAAPPQANPEDWPTFTGNNLGWNRDADAALPYCKANDAQAWEQCVTPAWKVRGINTGDHGAAKGSPILYDGTIYLGDDTGRFMAFDENGTLLWDTYIESSRNGIHGTPVADGDRVFIGGYDGAVYAFDRHTGDRIWRSEIGSWIGSSPRLYDGLLYIAVEHGGSTQLDGRGSTSAWGDVQILDPEDGDVVWRSQVLGSHPHSTLAISTEDDVFVVGCNDDYVYAWDLSTRELRWRFHADQGEQGDIKGPIAIYDGAAFFGSWDHHFYRVDLETGQEDWSYDTGDWIMTGTAVDPDTGTVYFGGHARAIYALDATTGELRWKVDTERHQIGAPTLAGQTLLFGSSDYGLYAIDKDTGDVLWRYPTLHRVSSAPVIVGDRIVFVDRAETPWGGTDGILYALAPPAGP